LICIVKEYLIFKVNKIMLLNKYISWFQHSVLKDIYSNCVIANWDTWTCSPIYSSILSWFDYNVELLHNKHLTFMTFVSYRKTQIKDEECKKFCKFLKDWTKRKAYIATSIQEHFNVLLRRFGSTFKRMWFVYLLYDSIQHVYLM
jgi:hypothetical protein